MAYTKGEIVLSLKGHDAGGLFCVLDAQDGFVRIVDGKGRKLAAPKRNRQIAKRRRRQRPGYPAGACSLPRFRTDQYGGKPFCLRVI